jgi:hypothetical protein
LNPYKYKFLIKSDSPAGDVYWVLGIEVLAVRRSGLIED